MRISWKFPVLLPLNVIYWLAVVRTGKKSVLRPCPFFLFLNFTHNKKQSTWRAAKQIESLDLSKVVGRPNKTLFTTFSIVWALQIRNSILILTRVWFFERRFSYIDSTFFRLILNEAENHNCWGKISRRRVWLSSLHHYHMCALHSRDFILQFK